MASTNDELTVSAIAAILLRRRGLVLRVLAAFVVAAVIYLLVATRTYEATGTIEVQQNSPDALDLKNLNGSNSSSSDALQANIDLQTQANILQSGSLALATIHALHLENSPEFKSKSLFRTSDSIQESGERTRESSADSAAETNRLLKIFAANLKVSPVGGTRLISIEYQSKDPKTASDVVNTLMRSLIDYTFETRLTATAQTSKWLGGQLADLRKQSEQLQAKVVNLQRQAGVYSLGATDPQGHEQAYSGVLERLQQNDLALAQAEQTRILKGAIAQAVQEGGAQALSSLAGNTPGQLNLMSVLQTLRQQEASQQAALVEAESKFGSAYPSVVELRANISGVQHAISQEEERIRNRARSDYQIAQQAEASTRVRSEAVHREAAGVNDKAVEFAIVKQEADQSRQLYEDLLKRLKEADVLEGLRSSNILVVDQARMPSKAKTPNKLLIMGIAFGAGLLAGCIAAALVNLSDDRVHTIDDVRKSAGAIEVFEIPSPGDNYLLDRGKPLVIEARYSSFLEGVRRLQLYVDAATQQGKILALTSAAPDEGTRVVGETLARVLAQAGAQVLLVNGLSSSGAAIDVRADRLGIEDVPEPQIGNAGLHANVALLDFLESDSLSRALLNRAYFDRWRSVWQERYDCILLLTRATSVSADSLLASRVAEHTILLTHQDTTQTGRLSNAVELLTRTQKPLSFSAVFLADVEV